MPLRQATQAAKVGVDSNGVSADTPGAIPPSIGLHNRITETHSTPIIASAKGTSVTAMPSSAPPSAKPPKENKNAKAKQEKLSSKWVRSV